MIDNTFSSHELFVQATGSCRSNCGILFRQDQVGHLADRVVSGIESPFAEVFSLHLPELLLTLYSFRGKLLPFGGDLPVLEFLRSAEVLDCLQLDETVFSGV